MAHFNRNFPEYWASSISERLLLRQINCEVSRICLLCCKVILKDSAIKMQKLRLPGCRVKPPCFKHSLCRSMEILVSSISDALLWSCTYLAFASQVPLHRSMSISATQYFVRLLLSHQGTQFGLKPFYNPLKP